MKKLWLLFILISPAFCLADSVTSGEVRKKSIVQDVPLSSAVRHGGEGYDANPWSSYWTFAGITPQKLTASSNSKLNAPQSGDASFSVVVGFMPDEYEFQGVVSKGLNGSDLEWWFHLNSNKDVVSRYSYNGSSVLGSAYGDLYYASAKCILLQSFDDLGSYYTWLAAGIPDSSGTGTISSTISSSSQSKPIYDGSGDFRIAAAESGVSYFDGKIYFVAIYHAALSIQDMEDIYDGTKHPVDDFVDTITFYVDFHQNVSTTYKSELGGITLTVTGSPTKGS